jgi:Tfp pilus assembly protein PilF
MNRYFTLIALLPIVLLTTGFNWGFGHRDKCGEAKKIAGGYAELKSAAERSEAVTRIQKLCPDGAASHFVKALNLEQSGNIDQAIAEYRETLKDAPELPEANGNLGLLYLQKGLADEASVELSKAMQGQSDPRYHKGLARIFKSNKLLALAGYHYREALKAYPGDAALHEELADVYSNQNLDRKSVV